MSEATNGAPRAPRHLEERRPANEAEMNQRKAWLKARCELELPPLPRDSQGHGYRYASLAEVLSLLDQPLRDAGFVVRWETWSPTATTMGVRCYVTHIEGWSEVAELIAEPERVVGGRMNAMQQRGAFATYSERYTLLAVLGYCADFDADGTVSEPVRDDTPIPGGRVQR